MFAKGMNNNDRVYKTRKEGVEHSTEYLFISRGHTDIVKVVQYQYIGKLDSKPIFNLGFGNYDRDTTQIRDDIISNNGDVYVVFNTVLSTIPEFFISNPGAIIMAQGSDSGIEFIENCRQTCNKNCQANCKKENRRITIYREYINKNYGALTKEYTFFGSSQFFQNRLSIENYTPGKKYSSILVAKNYS